MIDFTCPHCKQNLHIPDKYLGSRGKCNRCGGQITVLIQDSLVPKMVFGNPPTYKDHDRKCEQLIDSAAKGRRADVEQLLREGANVNARNRYGMMALHVAARSGFVELVNFLLVCGADVNAKAGDGCSALHWAAAAGRKEVVKFLAPRMLHIDVKDKDGQTPLHLAVRVTEVPASDVIEIFDFLLSLGANINVKANDGNTPLREAAELGHPEVAARIRELGGKS